MNGVSLEEVEHSEAIALLKDSGNQVELVVKRKILIPDPLALQPTKIALQKRNKKDGKFVTKFWAPTVTPLSLSCFQLR